MAADQLQEFNLSDALRQLHLRFLMALALVPLAPLILLRRLVRCLLHKPSRDCCGPSDINSPLEPSIAGMHRRFLQFYGDGSAMESTSSADVEVRVLRMQRRVTLEDGQEIAFWDVGPRDAKEVVLFCQGLGCRIAAWVPLFDALFSGSHAEVWRGRRIVIPEYRGQFSSVPLVGTTISVEQSARDAAAVAQALHVKEATVLCWSTGVQVGLELALNKPDLVKDMILIQGTVGDLLRCLNQPVCTIPGLPALQAWVLRTAPQLLSGWRREALYSFIVQRAAALERLASCSVWLFGSDFMPAISVRYLQDMVQSDAHFANYCAYAEALHRHKIVDRLPTIKAPSLVVTGTPDFITPARCSYELAARLRTRPSGAPAAPRVELKDDFGASHYFLLEEPHKLASWVGEFLASQRHEPATAGTS